MVTKFAAAHGVETAAKDLVGNYMSAPAAQSAARRRPTAATRRTSRPASGHTTRSWRSSARPASAACRCRTSRRWRACGRSSAARGSRRRRAPARRRPRRRLHDRRPQHRATRSASPQQTSRRAGARPGRPLLSIRDVDRVSSTSVASTAPTPRRERSAWSLPARRSPRSRARSGSSSRSSCSASSTRSRSGRPYVLAVARQVARVRRARARDGRRSTSIYLVPHRGLPAEVPVPGDVFLIAFQIDPVLYTSTSRSRTTRPVTSSRRARRSRRSRATRSSSRRTARRTRWRRRATRTASSC